MKKVYISAAMAFGLALAGCNTWDGMGEDVESAGDAVEDATDEVNDGDA
ncbi:Entericidin EcnAB [Pacificimonas flava]|uniref:Entericidin EcnAB n=2 Tax=Pacificimonas TaxID=1960290 RepID=A0A219B3K9_9SPHN|nr:MULTISPECIES: entericidin A/B family lipoprotein [Pacificimonas]MBZ6377949.1 entericidin A/B family lipoprotein [Pacificimonas aurantium]OWV32398.1 Entericidin EcnAB [Pacificimonas flava]